MDIAFFSKKKTWATSFTATAVAVNALGALSPWPNDRGGFNLYRCISHRNLFQLLGIAHAVHMVCAQYALSNGLRHRGCKALTVEIPVRWDSGIE